ncbi:MAG: hypothetical protein Q8K26_03535 [Candidatus Gracilibacteria bacterium]|nr:hypothetical protein [Candidatus Gracilibacteria bacterium]
MNKNYKITLLVLILIFGGLFLFFWKIRDFDFGSDFKREFFVRNLTWQTDFLSSVPYKKGDILEFTSIFSLTHPRDIGLDISLIKSLIDIERIELDGKTVSEKDLSQIHITESALLKITGRAKNTSTPENEKQDISPIIVTNTEVEIPKEAEVPKEVIPPEKEPSSLVFHGTKYNSNINNLISVTGSGLESIEFVNIGGIGFRPVLGSGTLFVQIDRDVFASGEYFVFLQLKSGKILTRNEKITFEHSSARINIANITPKSIRNDAERFVVIQGNGFDKIVSIQLSNNLILKNAEFNIINAHVAGVRIPKDLPPGEYYFNIMDTSAIYELRTMKFTVTH